MGIQVFEMITIIVVVSVLAGVVRSYLQSRRVEPFDSSKIEARLAKLEQLEERVITLEKIVTDKNYQLKNQIDSL